MIADEGDAFLAWHACEAGLNDAGRQLLAWYEQWRTAPGGRGPQPVSIAFDSHRTNVRRIKQPG